VKTLDTVSVVSKHGPMKNHFKPIVFALSVVILCGMPLRAQEPVVGSKDPESLFTSKDKKLNTNKQAVMHIMRDLLEAGHWDDAPKYLTARYIQHNPNVASGLQPVMSYFSGRGSRPIPDKNSWTTKIVSVVAEGDYVVVATVRSLPDPRDSAKTYTTTWFDMWRMMDGKADEHWDYGTIAPPAAGARATAPAAPAPRGAPGGRQ
jgi:predicted SnoaL-like aldol condensation-catalyzing enzyme